MSEQPQQFAETAAVERCDNAHPFNGLQCVKTMWHTGAHTAETSTLLVAWGFGYDDQFDGTGGNDA